MRRIIYAAGVNTKRLAETASQCPYWLLSVSLLPKKGPPAWLEPYLGRNVLWDPGTFSVDARTYPHYREWLSRYVRPHHRYLSYDEIGGDPDLNMAYLQDLRRRGFNPIPVYHPGMPKSVLSAPRVAVGSLVGMQADEVRQRHLDGLFYGEVNAFRPDAEVHLLGMGKDSWFERYPATSGDSTTWIPRFPWNRETTTDEWMRRYGVQEIPLITPETVQRRLAI